MLLKILVVSTFVASCLGFEKPRYRYVSAGDDNEYKKCTKSDWFNNAAAVTIWQHSNWRGSYQCIRLENENDCVTFNDWWTRPEWLAGTRISGATLPKEHDKCIRLHTGHSCTGVYLDFLEDRKDLSEFKFNDMAKSVSLCRKPPSNPDCEIDWRVLFTNKGEINPLVVSVSSSKVIELIDGITDLSFSVSSMVVPGLKELWYGVNLIMKLFSPANSIEALIDAKIESAIARNSASQISAKMVAIENRLKSIFNNGTPEIHRILYLGLALHTCEEVMELFKDSTYVFTKNKLVSSPYLVSFSLVYLVVAKLVFQTRPEERQRIAGDMKALLDLNEEYMLSAIEERCAKFECVEEGSYIHFEDKLVQNYRHKTWGHTFLDNNDHFCYHCKNNMGDSVGESIQLFFEPVITNLVNFVGSYRRLQLSKVDLRIQWGF